MTPVQPSKLNLTQKNISFLYILLLCTCVFTGSWMGDQSFSYVASFPPSAWTASADWWREAVPVAWNSSAFPPAGPTILPRAPRADRIPPSAYRGRPRCRPCTRWGATVLNELHHTNWPQHEVHFLSVSHVAFFFFFFATRCCHWPNYVKLPLCRV